MGPRAERVWTLRVRASAGAERRAQQPSSERARSGLGRPHPRPSPRRHPYAHPPRPRLPGAVYSLIGVRSPTYAYIGLPTRAAPPRGSVMSSEHPQQIEASFELVLSDILAAHRFLFWGSGRRRLGLLVIAAALVVALALGSWSLVVAVVLWLVVISAWLLYLQPRRTFLGSPGRGVLQKWTLGPDGLGYEMTASDGARLAESEMNWRSLVGARESGAAFLLASSDRTSFVLPKRGFEESAIADVRALLAASVAKNSG